MIGLLLRTGVLASAAVTIAGGIWHLAQGGALPDYRIFRPGHAAMHGFGEVWGGIVHGGSESLIQLGILMLIATPVARVALCLAAFAVQKDRIYMAITTVVLIGLLASLSGAHF